MDMQLLRPCCTNSIVQQGRRFVKRRCSVEALPDRDAGPCAGHVGSSAIGGARAGEIVRAVVRPFVREMLATERIYGEAAELGFVQGVRQPVVFPTIPAVCWLGAQQPERPS